MPAPPSSFDLAAVDAYLSRTLAARGFVGLSVAIVRDGTIVLEKGYGNRQLAPDLPVQADTAFEVGSITKQFVASLVLLLAQERKLSIDDPVAKYFPDLTRAGDVALRDLLHHVSGYRDDYPLDFVDEEMKKPVTAEEVIARYAKRPLDFEPRSRWSYSSTNYKILARVVEKVTGEPLAQVLRDRIFEPLGMTHTSYMPAAGAPGVARGYTAFALGPPEAAEPEARDWIYGGGGVTASAGDIARWDMAVMSGKVLGPDAYQSFITPVRLADGSPTRYGCGIAATTDKAGELVLRHSGADSGFQGYATMMPRLGAAAVVLSNRDDLPTGEIANALLGLLGKEHRPQPPKVEGPPAADVARAVFAELQSGHVDRARLGRDYDVFLTDAKLRGAASRLAPFGAPTDVRVDDAGERGGMEWTALTLSFSTRKLSATMFRSADGRVEEFFVENP